MIDAERTAPTRIGVLILAAGGSTRFGSAKAMARWGTTTLLGQALAVAKSVSDTILVVVGSHADLLTASLGDVPLVFNPAWVEGMGTSIALGLRTLVERSPALHYVLLTTIDQPLSTPLHLQRLLMAGRTHGKVVLTTDGLHRGPPACIPAAFFARAMALTHDHGLKAMLLPDEIVTVTDHAALNDADTPEALAALVVSAATDGATDGATDA